MPLTLSLCVLQPWCWLSLVQQACRTALILCVFAGQELAPTVALHFQGSKLVVIKGDLNYRKLLSDRKWPYTTLFHEAATCIAPVPFVALRTLKVGAPATMVPVVSSTHPCALKSNMIAGLDADTVARMALAGDDSWLTTGEYAVIQGCNFPSRQV
jgi:hypothetical protein